MEDFISLKFSAIKVGLHHDTRIISNIFQVRSLITLKRKKKKKKERLIFEIERKTIENTRIDLIVIGLPIYIKDRIDKETIHSTDDLIKILGQYEDKEVQMKGKEMQEMKVCLDRNSNPSFAKLAFANH